MMLVLNRLEATPRHRALGAAPLAPPAPAAKAPGMAADGLSLGNPAAALEKLYGGLHQAVAPHAAAFKAAIAAVPPGPDRRAQLEALYRRTAADLLPGIPPSVDEALGQAQLANFRANNKALSASDPRTRRAQAMVDRLAGPDARFPYKVTVFEADGMEAASVGGSTILMTTGMLEELDTDTKLAGVLGHEINHAEARDVVSTNLWDELAGLDKRRDAPKPTSLTQALARGLESAADAAGARRAHAAGYRPDGMAAWLLSEKTEAERRRQSREARLHPDASDHPTDAQRIADLRTQIARERLDVPPKGGWR